MIFLRITLLPIKGQLTVRNIR